MPSMVVQVGSGERRPLVIAYHTPAQWLRGLPKNAAVWSYYGAPFSQQYSHAGAGVVRPLAELVAKARAEGFEPDPLVILGWSEGCQGARAHIWEGADARDMIGGLVCLDGIHASTGFPKEHLEPWIWAHEQAAKDRLAFTWTTTRIATSGYESTRAVAQKVLGPIVDGTFDDGFFRLIAAPGKGKASHEAEGARASVEGTRVIELASKRSSGGGSWLGAIGGALVGGVCGGAVKGKEGAAIGALAGAAIGAIVGG